MQWRKAERTLGILACLALTACAGAPPAPPDRYHRIESNAQAAAVRSLPLISVYPYEGSGVYVERPLLYVDGGPGDALQQYHYDFWAEPALTMLEDSLVEYLRGAAGAERVFTRSARVQAALRIHPHLRQLEHQVQAGGGRAHLALEYEVFDAERKPLFVMAFDQTEPCSAQGPAAYVDAVGRLAAKAHAELLERLSRVRPASARSPPS